jgi:type IV secretory pathway TraG/TraD family ATPase VirD4
MDFHDELSRGCMVLVSCSKGKLGPQVSEAIGRLMVAQTVAFSFMQADTPPGRRGNVDLIIDEAHNYIGPDIETALTECRKYGLMMTLAQQYV